MKHPLRGLHVHFDPSSGIAGDMAVAALVDAGVPAKVVSDAIAKMGVRGLQVGFEKRRRGAFAGKGYVVRWPGQHQDHHHGHHHEHRDYAQIRRLLQRARLDAETKRLAGDIFARVAQAEAALHGVGLDRVTFHEVGAWDSIADVVGAAAAMAWLQPSSVSSTPPVLGSGQVHTAHGLMPVPAPATAAILRGVPALLEGEGELTTPTGAAILAALVTEFGPPPPLRIRAQGFGAGTREVADRANVLRVLLGEALGRALPASAPEVVLLEANLDDMSPQLIEPLMAALFAAGAVDVWTTSILMKKGRPAWQVSALVPPESAGSVEQAFFANSTTLGVRRAGMERSVLSRSLASVKTRFGTVSVKLAADGIRVLDAAPEFDDCRRLASQAGVPVRTVLAEASAAASRLLPSRKRD
jgi:pyridinium-3,5-bisthiocarboxylic acid mononucleotide nickel chelatase